MNKEVINLIKESVNREEKSNIDELYRTIWINTLIQFRENGNKVGVYFWLQKKHNNHYVIFYYGDMGLTEKQLNMNDEEKDAIEIMLLDDGFEITETKNNKTLIMIGKEAIMDFAKNSHEEKQNNGDQAKTYASKMPITPFAETRRSK